MLESNKTGYRVPPGYSTMRTLWRSFAYLKDPIKVVTGNMELFSGTYSAVLPGNLHLILTQDPSFIQYVLRDNHTNYQKSALTSDKAVRYFGKGVLFSNGEYWLKQRRLIQPGFHREKLQGLYKIIVRTIETALSAFPSGEGIDVYPLVHRAAFNVVIKSLFDIDLPEATMLELSEVFGELQDFFIKEVNQPFRKLLYPLNGADRKHEAKSKRLRAIFKDIIEQRRSGGSGGEAHDDLLDMLLNARYEDTGNPMSDDQLIDEIQVLIFAGHETTANTLSWLLYLLAGNGEVREALCRSIDGTAVLDSPGNVYINAVINESMRLYPAAWITERVALADDGFGAFSFPAGTIIIPFFYGLHRHADYWEEPDRFRPERFLADNGTLKKTGNYFPFGAGPRLCVGNNFAMAEMSFFVHAFLSTFTIAPTGRTPVMRPLLTLRPDKVVLDIGRIGA